MLHSLRAATCLAVASLAFVQAACGNSEAVVAPVVAVATTMTANSSMALSGVAGSLMTPAPSVLVKSQTGAAMPGVLVTFAVSSGGGSVTSGSAVTNSAGIATVGSWRLGLAPGSNSLLASSAGLASVLFSAAGSSSPATTISEQ